MTVAKDDADQARDRVARDSEALSGLLYPLGAAPNIVGAIESARIIGQEFPSVSCLQQAKISLCDPGHF